MSAAATLALLVLGRASLVVASIASMRIATALLGPDEMGAMNLLLGVIALPTLLVSPCGQYVNRRLMEWRLDGSLRDNFVRYTHFLLLAAVLSAVAAVPAMALLAPTATRAGAAPWPALLAAGAVAITSLHGALLHLCNLSGRRRVYVTLSNTASWGGLALAALACRIAGADAVAWMGALLCAQAFSAMLAVRLAADEFRPSPGGTCTPERGGDFVPAQVWPFAWPLLLCGGLYWAQRSLALPWLAGQAALGDLGRFSVAYSVGMLVMLTFDTLFKEAYGPLYYRATAHAEEAALGRAWNRYARAFVPAMTAAALCTAAAAQPLLRWLTAPAFHAEAAYVAWGAAGQWFVSLYSLGVLQAAGDLRNRGLLLPNLAGAMSTVLLLALPLGLEAGPRAALATSAGLACTALLVAARLARRPGLRWPLKRTAAAAALVAPVFGLAPLIGKALGHAPAALASMALFVAIAALGSAAQLALGGWWLRECRA